MKHSDFGFWPFRYMQWLFEAVSHTSHHVNTEVTIRFIVPIWSVAPEIKTTYLIVGNLNSFNVNVLICIFLRLWFVNTNPSPV